MQPVFDAPVATHGKSLLLGRKQGRGDVVAGLESTAVGKLDAGLHADDRGGVGEAILSWEAPVAVEPINVLNDADGPLFDAAVALVVVDEAVEAIRGGEALSVSARKLGWLALTASR